MILRFCRLVTMELRRNAGVWLFPTIPLAAWWLLSNWGWIPFLWDSTNAQLQASVAPFAVPAVAGIAAWMAGRDRRRGIEDLLASTPLAPEVRELALWGGTAGWGVLAYVAFAAWMTGRTALSATWGGPDLWRVAIVIAAIFGGAALGMLIGRLIPSRLTPPVVAVASFGAVLFLANHATTTVTTNGELWTPSWINYLAPDRAAPAVAPWQATFHTGLTGTALVALAMRHRRTRRHLATLVAASVLTLSGGVMVWSSWPRYDPATGLTRDGWGRPITPSVTANPPVEPVCRGSPVSVCVHPQYLPVLDRAVVEANGLAEPLLGLPGVPMRVDERAVGFVGGGSFSVFQAGSPAWLDVTPFADELVAAPASRVDGRVANPAQLAVRFWLIERAGIGYEGQIGCHAGAPALVAHGAWRPLQDVMPGTPQLPGMPTPAICQAAERFGRLSPTEQRAWLEAHYTDLRAGRLDLDDLP